MLKFVNDIGSKLKSVFLNGRQHSSKALYIVLPRIAEMLTQ